MFESCPSVIKDEEYHRREAEERRRKEEKEEEKKRKLRDGTQSDFEGCFMNETD